MPVLARFETPAKLRDLASASKRKHWSDRLVDDFRPLVRRFGQLYDPTRVDTPADAKAVPVTWAGSPNKLRQTHGDAVGRWRIADSHRSEQDEYCEWSLEKSGGKVTRVTFTTEVPEYYEFLARENPERLLALYRELVGPRVAMSDLIVGGDYQRVNRWNPPDPAKGRLVHLSQENNTLGAALALVAEATVQRERDGVPVTTKEALAGCSGLGNPFRNSDPQIAAIVNGAAGTGASITLQDPIGLYLDRLVTTGMTTPDGANPAGFWKIERGTPGHAVRASFAVPNQHGYAVGDIRIGGRPIKFGAQVADRVRVRITAIVKPGSARPRRRPCLR
jgi:hypothetical protein